MSAFTRGLRMPDTLKTSGTLMTKRTITTNRDTAAFINGGNGFFSCMLSSSMVLSTGDELNGSYNNTVEKSNCRETRRVLS